MAWAIVISLILLAVIYILITPVHLYINSAENQFYIQQRGLGKANLEWDDDEMAHLVIGIAAANDEHMDILTNLAEVIEEEDEALALGQKADAAAIMAALGG